MLGFLSYTKHNQISQLNVGLRALHLNINKRMFKIGCVARSIRESEMEILNIRIWNNNWKSKIPVAKKEWESRFRGRDLKSISGYVEF